MVIYNGTFTLCCFLRTFVTGICKPRLIKGARNQVIKTKWWRAIKITSANQATVVCNQSLVEERHGFNLMISILSQSKDGDCKMLLYKSVYHLAEIFVIMMMDITQLPDADQLMRIIEVFPHDDLPSEVNSLMVSSMNPQSRRLLRAQCQDRTSNSTRQTPNKIDDRLESDLNLKSWNQ